MIVRLINRTTNETITYPEIVSLVIANGMIDFFNIKYNQFNYPINEWGVIVE